MKLSLELSCTAANETSVGEDGFALLAPYGDAPNVFTLANPAPFRAAFPTAAYVEEGGLTKVEGIQRITAANSAPVAEAFASLTGRVKRWFRGSPIYNGHPDMPGATGDATELGLISRLEARADGQYGQPIFNAAGANELTTNKAKLFFSPRYQFEPTGVEGGKIVFEPRSFVSTGLTPFPNLAAAAANAAMNAATPPPDTMNITKIVTALALAGAPPSNEAEESILASINTLGQRATTGATAANERTNLQAEVTRLTGELTTLRTEAANQATTFRDGQIAAAVQDGRITAAQKPQFEALFKADAANAALVLAALPKVIKTGDRSADSATQTQATAANETAEGFVQSYKEALKVSGTTKEKALITATAANAKGYQEWLTSNPQPKLA
jgi:hypothetical protein